MRVSYTLSKIADFGRLSNEGVSSDEMRVLWMKLMWLGYLVYSLGNCAMKLYIETGLGSLIFGTKFILIINNLGIC